MDRHTDGQNGDIRVLNLVPKLKIYIARFVIENFNATGLLNIWENLCKEIVIIYVKR